MESINEPSLMLNAKILFLTCKMTVTFKNVVYIRGYISDLPLIKTRHNHTLLYPTTIFTLTGNEKQK